jgi:hypothetical protein
VVNPKIRKIGDLEKLRPKNGLSDLEDESINKIAMVSCRSSFLWINGELLVGIYFGVLMESFL